MLQGRLATINTYICTMHPEGCDVFVINPRQWEVQEENAKIKRKKSETKNNIQTKNYFQASHVKNSQFFLNACFKNWVFSPLTMLKLKRKYLLKKKKRIQFQIFSTAPENRAKERAWGRVGVEKRKLLILVQTFASFGKYTFMFSLTSAVSPEHSLCFTSPPDLQRRFTRRAVPPFP